MKEKFTVTSLMTGAFSDATVTYIGIQKGFSEVGLGMKNYIETGNFDEALILKIAITTLIIGAYVLSKESRNESLNRITDKFARGVNIITWSVVALNAVRIAGGLN